MKGRNPLGEQTFRKAIGQEAHRCDVWGVLNITPDSFSDGGEFLDTDDALARGHALVALGADVVDVGGESTRPGFSSVSVAEERARVVDVVTALCAAGVSVSIDTVKADVAQACVEAGAHYINDVSCGTSSDLLSVAAASGVALVLMHNRQHGTHRDELDRYTSLLDEVRHELDAAIDRAIQAGVSEARIWIDPGIGFAKNASQSAALIARTDHLVAMGYPVLVGPSRKSFIAHLLPDGSGGPTAADRVGGTAASVAIAVSKGAKAVRVHDVAVMHQVVRLCEAIKRCGQELS